MQVYIIRHGDALDTGERPLSPRGRDEAAIIAGALRKIGVAPDAIYTSPLARAKETAEIVGKALHAEPVVTPRLDSGTTFMQVDDLLAGHDRSDVVVLVGHQPDLGTIAGLLIGGGSIEMKKATVAAIECDRFAPGHGVLQWLVHPKVLAAWS
jgi:phosphohistidine phosphatase